MKAKPHAKPHITWQAAAIRTRSGPCSASLTGSLLILQISQTLLRLVPQPGSHLTGFDMHRDYVTKYSYAVLQVLFMIS